MKKLHLIGCGIDSEYSQRFKPWSARQSAPSPLIFSPKEISHCFLSPGTATALCISFCCKEAVFKAIGEPYNFNTCELFYTSKKSEYSFSLESTLRNQHNICKTLARVITSPDGECIVTVFLFS